MLNGKFTDCAGAGARWSSCRYDFFKLQLVLRVCGVTLVFFWSFSVWKPILRVLLGRMKNLKKQPKISKRRNQRIRPPTNDEQVTELLKLCLQKVCELQAEMERNEESENDPEAAGYAACATEALRFLTAEGLPPNHPMVKSLRDRLMGNQS